MKKNMTALALCASLMGALLAGCTQTETETESVISTVSQEESVIEEAESFPEEIVSEAESVEETVESQVETAEAESTADKSTETQSVSEEVYTEVDLKDSKTVKTGYYEITVPEDHLDSYVVRAVEDEDSSRIHALEFYEAEDYEEFGGGYLYSVCLYDRTADYSFLPNYKELGTLMTENGTLYNLVIEYPSDVQFTQDTDELYHSMLDEEKKILKSLKPDRGNTFTEGECDHSLFGNEE